MSSLSEPVPVEKAWRDLTQAEKVLATAKECGVTLPADVPPDKMVFGYVGYKDAAALVPTLEKQGKLVTVLTKTKLLVIHVGGQG